MRQFAAHRVFVEPPRNSAVNVDTGVGNFNQLLMLAIERALAPPVVHRRTVFQPMRVIVVDPALLGHTNLADEAQVALPKVLPRAVPHAADNATFRAPQVQHRAVRGEILSDESGRLYEKLGRQIRPIHQLASGQFGEVIDLVPAAPPVTRMIPPPTGPKAIEPAEVTKAQSGPEDGSGKNADSSRAEFIPLRQTQPQQPTAVSHHKLFADPGQWRVIWWGEFKEILASQLAHPERLRDTYRLPCYVQVLETERVVSIEELAAAHKSDNEHHARFYFLTNEIAAKLDLILPLRPAPPHHSRREPNTLLTHERVFRLLVANDPTVDVTMSKNRLPTSGTKAATIVGIAKGGDPAASSTPLKEEIPGRFVKEWEFKLTREEVSYDMSAKPTIGGLLRKFCSKLRVIKHGSELRKWQTLLAGRSVDEQLWAVRPPASMLADSFVREWANKALESGGYNAKKMIMEWEIFWRRRGL